MRQLFIYPSPGIAVPAGLYAAAGDTPDFCLLEHGGRADGWYWMAAFSAAEKISPEPGNCFPALRDFIDQTGDWIFGHLGYDLKNEVERLTSGHPDHVGFPLLHFFRPRFLIRAYADRLEIEAETKAQAETLYHELLKEPVPAGVRSYLLNPLTDRETYRAAFENIHRHIARGDIYEINYCIEFAGEAEAPDTAALYHRLRQRSEAPFSAFYRCDDRELLCASPERYLQKTGHHLRSQPIKGTAARHTNPEADAAARKALRENKKEQSENVMIVDLVRNDLSRVAARGTVQVDELFGIYTFKTVHQMISTVSAELREGLHPVDALIHTFPMGSMTGAPKIRAMEIIEEAETSRRGLFSGAVGYFTPEGDFDFNVVIRSLQYNRTTGYLSLITGSAITAAATADAEYDECLLKASAILEVASGLETAR